MLAIGTAASVLGVATLGAGIRLHRPDAAAARPRATCSSCSWPSVGAFAVMEWALFAHDFSLAYVADNLARATPGLYTFTGRVERARGLDPVVGARPCRRTSASPRGTSATAPSDPLVAWATLVQLVVLAVLLRAHAVPGEPVQGDPRHDPDRRAGPEPAAAEQPARRDPPADPLRGVRRLHDPVLVRDRRARHRSVRRGLARRRAAHDARRVRASSPSASCSARCGATRCSAGAATGAGTRSRTRRCCRGSPRPRSSTR